MQNDFNKIIKEICNEENIKFEELSNDYIIKLTKDNIVRFIIGYKFDLNTQALSKICDDKYALFTVLSSLNINTISSSIIYKNEEEKLLEYFNNHNKNIVLKPNMGTCGIDVVKINDENKLKEEYKRLSSKNYSLNVSPYYDIESEYRVIYLNEVKYIYKKVKPVIIGDGVKTIKELLYEFNSNYFNEDKKFDNKNIDINYIPQKHEVIEYEWRFNLSRGANIKSVNDIEKEILTSFVNKITEKLNLKFCSIDIIKTNNEYLVMEINSGIMMKNLILLKENGYDIAKDIYKTAIEEMFK